MKLWLVGMMGSGKTSAGRLAAKNLKVQFLDTDDLVVERTGRSILQTFAEEGEQAFRDAEREVVSDLQDEVGIIATGGGVVTDDENRSTLRRSGIVVWIDATPASLAARIGPAEDRPLLSRTGQSPESVLAETLAARRGFYSAVADHRIATDDLEVAETARRIEDIWKS